MSSSYFSYIIAAYLVSATLILSYCFFLIAERRKLRTLAALFDNENSERHKQ